MNTIRVLSEAPVTMVELSEELQKIKKRDGELNFRANKTEEYLTQFVQLKPSEAKELFKKIQELNIPRLKDDHITKMMDILPKTVEEVKSIISSYPITVSAENCKKIADIVKENVR
ncbi:hypothetical protein HYS47_05230 [Candidatus Woesearchaeota archaeon]|nr:hypothetical protein [Candidatus Woesearchaeota archaeon]